MTALFGKVLLLGDKEGVCIFLIMIRLTDCHWTTGCNLKCCLCSSKR